MRGSRLRKRIFAIAAALVTSTAVGGESVRESALAGAWYPGDPKELAEYVDGLLDGVRVTRPEGTVRALVAPHAGYRYSGATAAGAIALIRGKSYQRVIVLAPSHRSGFRGLSIADVAAYETPLGSISLDAEAIAALRRSDLVVSDPVAHQGEHAIEIELPLLQRALAPAWRLVPVLVGRLEGADYGKAVDLLRPLADEDTLLVVSSDFTHFGPRFRFMPFPLDDETPGRIRALDDGAIEPILAADAAGFLDYQERTGITVCGYRPLALLLHMLPADAVVERVAYSTSGDLTGDYGNSVSYAALVVMAPNPFSAENAGITRFRATRTVGESDLKLLHRLAVLAVGRAVIGLSQRQDPELGDALQGLPAHLREPSGAFVTLKRKGHLRGCIGNIQPRRPLYLAVLEHGVNAARNDHRFRPMGPDELKDLEVEVSVLSPPRGIGSFVEFRVGEQGVILRKDGHRALFLPEVALEQGWTREDTLSHLALKAGLNADAWREGASLEVFTSTKYTAPYAAASMGGRPAAPSGDGAN